MSSQRGSGVMQNFDPTRAADWRKWLPRSLSLRQRAVVGKSQSLNTRLAQQRQRQDLKPPHSSCQRPNEFSAFAKFQRTAEVILFFFWHYKIELAIGSTVAEVRSDCSKLH